MVFLSSMFPQSCDPAITKLNSNSRKPTELPPKLALIYGGRSGEVLRDGTSDLQPLYFMAGSWGLTDIIVKPQSSRLN